MPKQNAPYLRRKARILALQTLYEADTSRHPPQECLERLLQNQKLPEHSRSFARELIQGTQSQRTSIDKLIARYAPAYPVEQLSSIDRNILRITFYEILFSSETPPKAAINEAVEIAKLFGSESSPRFINGVLGSLMKNEEQEAQVLHKTGTEKG